VYLGTVTHAKATPPLKHRIPRLHPSFFPHILLYKIQRILNKRRTHIIFIKKQEQRNTCERVPQSRAMC